MSVTKRLGLLGTLAVALVLGLAACQTSGTMTSLVTDTGEETFTSWLAKPDGEGPFPAVVLMHGCSGTERNTSHQTVWRGLNRHVARLNDYGYVTLIVDSFGPRRITDGCQTGGKYYPVQLSDAHAAFDHLASLSFVDAERIGFAGWSLGGGTALRLAAEGFGRVTSGYSAVVAYYPYCSDYFFTFDLPVLILIGADDDWTPARLCRAIAKRAPEHIDLTVYPDTHHSFDLPMGGPYYIEGANGEFHRTQGNDKAYRDAQARMLAFFAKHLGGPYPATASAGVDAAGHSGFGNILRAAFALND